MTMILVAAAAIVIIVLLVAITVSAKAPHKAAGSLPYVLRPELFSAGERAFLKVLDEAVEVGHRVFGKTRIADIVAVQGAKDNAERARAFNQISAKHVDFVVCDRDTFRILYAVELDDKSHAKAHRAKRDAFVDEVFSAIGTPLVHVQAKAGYSVDAVRALLPKSVNGDQPKPVA